MSFKELNQFKEYLETMQSEYTLCLAGTEFNNDLINVKLFTHYINRGCD